MLGHLLSVPALWQFLGFPQCLITLLVSRRSLQKVQTFEVVGHFSHGQTELWLLEKTVEMTAQLITFSWGEGEAASTPLIADFFFFLTVVTWSEQCWLAFSLPPGISLLVGKAFPETSNT